MSKIKWDATGYRFFENGTKNAVLYPWGEAKYVVLTEQPADWTTNYTNYYTKTGNVYTHVTGDSAPTFSSNTYYEHVEAGYEKGVAWNGLTAITESPSGGDANDLYADDMKYATLRAAEDFGGTIEAYTYPEEFAECDGSKNVVAGVKIGQQKRKNFGLCYRTNVGNDVDPEIGYQLHIIYNASASPSERSYQTINDSPDAITFSWEFTTIPVAFTDEDHADYKPTACVVIDTTKLDSAGKTALKNLEDKLYGTDPSDGTSGTDPELPDIDTVLGYFED